MVDEVHALKHLSALPLAITEGRKHGLKLVIGTQNKSQLEEYYGHGASTMLASFSTKIILRCNEPECARWLSDLIGEDETERVRISTTAFSTKIILRCNEPECARWLSDLIGEDETERVRISTTASVPGHGRDSTNYNNVTEQRAAVSKEEIMSLPNLHGYWKHGNLIVPFRIEPLELEDIARSFIQRKTPPVVSQVAVQSRIARPHENGRENPEIATATVEEIDISF
jgi:type IV secretory pathway TraG/TraD family ATPase VirD4